MSILTFLYLILSTVNLAYKKEINHYVCTEENTSLSVDLKNNEITGNSDSFTFSFWSKYQLTSNFPLFSIDSLKTKIVFGIDVNQTLTVNNEKTLLGPLTPSIDIYQSEYLKEWNFFVVFMKRNIESDTFDLDIVVNDLKLQKNFSFKTDNEFLYLILGGDSLGSKCAVVSEFQNLILYQNESSFGIERINDLAGEKAEIIFLSKFNKQPSYNKFYSNFLKNQFGPIKNGIKNNSFAFFTSLATSHNRSKIKAHMIHDLSLFLMPDGLLNSRDVNQSYIFIMQFDLFYVDFLKSNSQNNYPHVLYQRYSAEGVEILIRTDINVIMGQLDNEIIIQNFINEKIVNRKNIKLNIKQSGNLKLVPINYIMVKVYQTPLTSAPNIVFENGYDKKPVGFKIPVKLNPSDKHLFGDNERRDATRKEYFTFVNIKEVMFLKGSFIKKNTEEGTVNYYSGFDNIDQVIICNETNNPNRGKYGNVNLLSCESDVEQLCNDKNCDICDNVQCIICDPGYELINSECKKCGDEQGYDPTLKKCYDGSIINNFYQTQFGNLLASTLGLSITSDQIIYITLKIKPNPELLSNKAFLFFLNNVDSHNRLMDMCFQDCEDKIHEIYFALGEKEQLFQLDYLIFGNSSSIAIQPVSIVYKVINKTDLDIGLKYKNFDCSMLSSALVFEFSENSEYFGDCKSKCEEGYFIDTLTKNCLKCPADCKTCSNNSECESCKDSKILVNGKCQSCQQPCTRCIKSVNICLSCSAEEYFDPENKNCFKKCKNLPLYCEACNYRTGKCAICTYGYTLKNDQCELSVCNVKNCLTCSKPNTCSKCANGFEFENGFCQVCKRNCDICPIGYTLNFRKICLPTEKQDKDIVDVVVKPFVPDIKVVNNHIENYSLRIGILFGLFFGFIFY